MLILTIRIFSIFSMLIFMLTSIWGFILLIKIFNQLRYKNYLLEKLLQNASSSSSKQRHKEYPKDDFKVEDISSPGEK
ncbi:hypothetical protein K2F40_02490 [Clostridium sp. CM028]|uniref:hypothetical protein n=1 Tax=unclassified Clostridium TaxID=2614128 RepID=UPI001C6E4FAA|nr:MULTISPECIES: hypothetical protein [unclassified Clostridium]MBW9144607.1 hypothetical protein [Clostridium sp. CM027]MBW9147867.1 hypothetical protein [Clostridium sp. CM028]UVE40634.1 hypothetical protein KTC92_16205 [Clostridium sp. CM027]WLC61305.1 hypothetical protein KTC94_14540 [Clostridium sp. CM028]